MTLEELSHMTFYEMDKYSQFTIDAVQDIEDDLEEMDSDEKGSYSYGLKNVLEIIDKEKVDDINAINSLIQILESDGN